MSDRQRTSEPRPGYFCPYCDKAIPADTPCGHVMADSGRQRSEAACPRCAAGVCSEHRPGSADPTPFDDAEIDSPPFKPAALSELEARGYRRINVPRTGEAKPQESQEEDGRIVAGRLLAFLDMVQQRDSLAMGEWALANKIVIAGALSLWEHTRREERLSRERPQPRGVEAGVAQKVRERSGQSTPETAPAAVQAVAIEQRACNPCVPGSSPGSSLHSSSARTACPQCGNDDWDTLSTTWVCLDTNACRARARSGYRDLKQAVAPNAGADDHITSVSDGHGNHASFDGTWLTMSTAVGTTTALRTAASTMTTLAAESDRPGADKTSETGGSAHARKSETPAPPATTTLADRDSVESAPIKCLECGDTAPWHHAGCRNITLPGTTPATDSSGDDPFCRALRNAIERGVAVRDRDSRTVYQYGCDAVIAELREMLNRAEPKGSAT